MLLRIETRDANGIAVLDLHGGLGFGLASQSLAQQVKELVARGTKRIVVNLAGVAVIDSGGVGELIACYTTVKKLGGTLKLAGARDQVREVLQIVRLPAVVEVFETVELALTSFA
jgi:anti-sigma B factor antagonist